MTTDRGTEHADVEGILDARRQKARRGRRNWFAGGVVAIGVLAFLLVPAMREPFHLWRLNHSGVQGVARVQVMHDLPASCDSGCWEKPYVSIPYGPDTSWAGVMRHHIASGEQATPEGGTFPVWFIPPDYALLTAQAPGSAVAAALTHWSWLLLLILAAALYEPLDRAWARRRHRV